MIHLNILNLADLSALKTESFEYPSPEVEADRSSDKLAYVGIAGRKRVNKKVPRLLLQSTDTD